MLAPLLALGAGAVLFTLALRRVFERIAGLPDLSARRRLLGAVLISYFGLMLQFWSLAWRSDPGMQVPECEGVGERKVQADEQGPGRPGRGSHGGAHASAGLVVEPLGGNPLQLADGNVVGPNDGEDGQLEYEPRLVDAREAHRELVRECRQRACDDEQQRDDLGREIHGGCATTGVGDRASAEAPC